MSTGKAVIDEQEVKSEAPEQVAEGEAKSTPKLRVLISKDLFRHRCTMREFIAIQEGNLQVMNQVLARFIVDEGGHSIPAKDAAEIIIDLPLEEYDELANQFRRGMQNSTVPLAK